MVPTIWASSGPMSITAAPTSAPATVAAAATKKATIIGPDSAKIVLKSARMISSGMAMGTSIPPIWS
jgi:hypothetical protein